MASNNFSFVDFYIGYEGHPRFNSTELIEDDLVRVIIQKYEMIIFTNKGEVLDDPNFGGNLLLLLNETKFDSTTIEGILLAQIDDYIPELEGIDWTLTVDFFEDPVRHQDYMVINFTIAGYQVYAEVK